MNDRPFLEPEGRPGPPLPAEAVAQFWDIADGFNATRLLIAILEEDVPEIDRILREFPAVPLLSGVAGVALALGGILAEDDPVRLHKLFDFLALSPKLDHAGTANAYRARVTP